MADSNSPRMTATSGQTPIPVSEYFPRSPPPSIPPPIDRSTKPKRSYIPSPSARRTSTTNAESDSPNDIEISSTDSSSSIRSPRKLTKHRRQSIPARPQETAHRATPAANDAEVSSAASSTYSATKPRKLTKQRRYSTNDSGIGTSSNTHAGPSNDLQILPMPTFEPVGFHQSPQTGRPDDCRNPFDSSDSEDNSSQNFANMVTRLNVSPRYDPEAELKQAGKGRVGREKRYLIAALLAVNFIFIFATWWWPRYYYVYLPFITLTVFLNSVMVLSVILNSIRWRIFPEKKIVPPDPETLIYIVPCYNESPEELTRSLDSLTDQTDIDQHRRAVMIICDGRVRGPGMEKTTAEYLLDDLLVEKTSRRFIKGAYYGWFHDLLDVEVQEGTYKGLPYFCIIKQENQGKRDSLIALRSFLYNFNIRAEHPSVIFSNQFFGDMASFLVNSAGMQNVTYLVGMDGDTVFADNCVYELIKESRYPNTVGVCGYVAVDFTRGRWGQWNLWNLYQSAEYTISQGLRRFHQSIVTKKVSCLPGCCQLLRVCETTCGDKILLELFGYCPKPTDSMLKHIRATASEDRNHVCRMLSAFPKAETRQALRARAYTDVPHSWSVFLSQRRRWTLGATSNDLFLITAPGIYWFERILAFANCLVWSVNVFVFASLACLIAAALRVEGWIILCFSAVMLVPVLYYFALVFWIPRTFREKLQYTAGCLVYITCGPFLNIIVLLYALWNMDSFGWGKTRKVIVDDTTEKVAVGVTVPVDEESEIGLKQPPRRKPSKKDIVAILGCDTYTQKLLKAFGKEYRTIVYDPSEEVAARARQQFSSADGYNIEITSGEQQLARANIFLITAAPEPHASHQNEARADPTPFTLRAALALATRHAKQNDIIMLDGVFISVGTTRSLLGHLSLRGIFCGYSPSPAPTPSTKYTPFPATPKPISALSQPALSAIESIYSRAFTHLVPVASPEAAEMSALLDSAHRASQGMLALESRHAQGTEKVDMPEALQESFRRMADVWRGFIAEAERGAAGVAVNGYANGYPSGNGKERVDNAWVGDAEGSGLMRLNGYESGSGVGNGYANGHGDGAMKVNGSGSGEGLRGLYTTHSATRKPVFVESGLAESRLPVAVRAQ